MTRKGNRTSENTQLFLLFPQDGRYQQSSTGLMSDHFYSSPTTTSERSHRRPHWPQNKRNLGDGRNHPNYPTPNQFRHLLKIIQAASLLQFPFSFLPPGPPARNPRFLLLGWLLHWPPPGAPRSAKGAHFLRPSRGGAFAGKGEEKEEELCEDRLCLAPKWK